jgi:Ni/Fe-hydrogenase subunit HybB-like protein
MAIVAYSVLAWIFSLTLQPGWNSTIFAPNFIVAGLYSGISESSSFQCLSLESILNWMHYIIKKHFVM